MPGGGPGGMGGPGGGGGGGGSGNTMACPNTTSGVDTVELARSSETYKMFFTGCPQYSPFGQTTGNTPSFQNATYSFRVAPVIAATPTYHSRTKADGSANPNIMLGPIGIAVNGVPIFNDADAVGADAIINEGATLDDCRGHAAPGGVYHYHSEPGTGCAYTDTAGKHSPLYGIMLDSIPIYGAYGDNGAAPTDLDECGGHTDATYAFYHYHVTANLAPPYTTRCFRGCLSTNAGGGMSASASSSSSCTPAAKQYDYSALDITWMAPFHVAHESEDTSSSSGSSSSGGSGAAGTSPAAGGAGPRPSGPRPEDGPAPGAKPKDGAPGPRPADGPAPGAKPEDGAPGPRPADGPAPGAKPEDGAPGPRPADGPAPGAKPEDGTGPRPADGPAPGAKPEDGAPGPRPADGPAPGPKPEDGTPGPRPEGGPAPGPKPEDGTAPRPADGPAPGAKPATDTSVPKPASAPKTKSRPSPRARPSPRGGKRGLSRRMIEA
ncbi:hypothetical protein HXX76_008688 [Chlamydomonas incerta]|uniref:YHYH domain-containing protein n=1 Tax=Chlamydomonas incerta TaxID=51695 RepID=A0A835T5Q3_CHLIN|nr:hypothetical protein HXX76_008688 [Chlamydomonas incerta]|eukprot:KAG2432960.1 hypothetical protein HXX76_008688 [Chlamydomonas incerta]